MTNSDTCKARRPWRTLIRVKDIQQANGDVGFAFIVVPAWSSRAVVKLPADSIPTNILKRIRNGSRLHAKVNIGAVRSEDLFFEEWELPEGESK